MSGLLLIVLFCQIAVNKTTCRVDLKKCNHAYSVRLDRQVTEWNRWNRHCQHFQQDFVGPEAPFCEKVLMMPLFESEESVIEKCAQKEGLI